MERKTETITNFEIDIAFITARDYFFGDENNPKDIERMNELSEKIYAPFLDDVVVNSLLVYNNFEEIKKYYESVFILAEKYKKQPSKYYFWIRPYIKNTDTNEILVSYPWYDTFKEAKNLFSSLRENKEGCVFYDVDQCWEFKIEHQNGKFYILEQDPENNEIYCQINIDKAEVLKQLNEVEERTSKIIQRLTNVFKKDFWTH